MKKLIVVLLIVLLWAPSAMADCAAECSNEQGICFSYCGGDTECMDRCARSYQRCLANCSE